MNVALIAWWFSALVPAAPSGSLSPSAPVSTAPAAPGPSATAAASSAPSPSPSDDARALARAREWLARLQKGDLDRAQLSPDLSAAYRDATLASLSKQLRPLGTPDRFVLLDKHASDGTTTWVYRVTWPGAIMDYTFGLDGQGKIAALYLRPGPPPPRG